MAMWPMPERFAMPEAGRPDHRLVTKGMSMSRKKLLHVSGWPLRRKLALVIAVPLLLAATFGTLRVYTELAASADHAATASQVTVLPPAVDYLNAAENAAIVARHNSSVVDPKRDEAIEYV